MPNEDEVLQDKPVQLKGVDTSGSDIFEEKYGDLKKDYRTRDLTPKTAEEAFSKGIQTYGTEITTGDIGGTSSVDFELLNELYAPVNLAEGIPDHFERTQYLDRYGDKMVQLATPDTFAVRFENDLLGLNAYNEKKYPLAVKRFIDELDENQGIFAEMFNITGSLVGKTAVALTGAIPLFYGIGSAILNGDSTKVFDNDLFDAWEYMDNALSENFVVYGGSDIYDFDPETGEFKQKNFFGRIWNDPIKSVSSDIVPAAAFIGGAVLGEMGFAKIPKIGGITKGIATIPALGTSWFSKSVRVARGLDKLDDFAAMRRIATHRKFFEGGLKTIGTAIRTSGYESALIARSTQERTLNNLIEAHYQNFGTEPTDYEMAQYQKVADQAGDSAFALNVPLVAGSTFLQFPRLFGRNWTLHRTGASILNKYKIGKTRIVDYKRVANADASNFVKYLGYTTATAGRGITEAWEEFAQGAMEEGLMDYYTYPYQKDTVGEKIGFLNAMSKAANNFANSQEGLDSIAIGGLMGLLGMPLPGKINDDGSISGGFQWHGGAVEGIRETRNKIRKARENAALMNSSNEMLMNNFAEFSKQRKIQESQDDFAMANDIYNFKNKEFEGLVNYVMARHENGISDTIEQDLESLEAMPLEQFNKQFAAKDVTEFTEETKREALKNAKERVRDVLDSIEGVDAILADDPTFMDGFNKYLAGKYGQKISQIDQSFFQKAFREYLIYLDAAGKNADVRKDRLAKEINEATNGVLSSVLFENAEEIIVGIDPKAESLAEAIEFSDQAIGLDKDQTLLNSIMEKWKEKDPKSYNKNSKKLKKKIEDIIKLGGRSSRAAALFNSLFTKKGFQSLADFSVELNELARAELKRRAEALAEELAKNPNSQSKKELNADSMFGKDNAARVKRAKDTLEQLKKVKKLADSMDESVSAEERKEALLKELDKNPALFKTIKDNLSEDPDNPLDLTGIATIAELKNLGDDYVNAVVDMLEEMLTNFKGVAQALEEFIEQGGTLPPNQKEEGIDGDIISGEKDIEEAFKPGTRTAPVGMILITPDKDINTINREHRKPSDHLAKTDEGWQENGKYSLNNALINSSEFLSNLNLQEGTHEVVFRVKENQDAKFLEDPNQTIINTYYIDPNTGEEIFVGRLPAYNFDSQGNPKEMAYLAELRKAIIKREEVLKNISEEGTQEVSVAEQIVNTINKIKDIDSKIAKAEEGAIEVSEAIVKEILKNKDFIKGKTADGTLVDIDSGEEYQNYVKIDEEGNIIKEYQRVTDFISEEDTEAEDITQRKLVGNDLGEATVTGEKFEITINKPAMTDTFTVSVTQKGKDNKYRKVKALSKEGLTYEEAYDWVNEKVIPRDPSIYNLLPKAKSPLLKSSTIIGTKVDTLVRDFFAGKINKDSSKEDIDSYEFETQETRNFLKALEKVKATMEARGEKVVANDIILYNDELGIAGTVDLLTYDKNGKFRIYDMKTMRGNQLTEKHKSGDNKGKTKYDNAYKKGQDSNKVKHQKQLSLYRILLANTHGIVAETLGVMPIVVNYEAGDTTSSKLELIKGIPVKALDKIENAELKTKNIDQSQVTTQPQAGVEYNYNPSNVSEEERNDHKQYVLDKLGRPVSITFETSGNDSFYRFTFSDGLIIETQAKGKMLTYPKPSEKLVKLVKEDLAYGMKFLIGLNKLAEETITQPQTEIIDRSSIPENVISIEVPDPTGDFMVSFTDEAGKKLEVFVGNDAQGNPYIKLNNPPLDSKGRRPSRDAVDTLARKYLGDGLVDFMLSWKALSKEDEQIIQYHVLGVPLRDALDSEFYNPVTIEEINQQYEDKISSEIKEGVDKYLKPFAQETLEKTVQRLEEEYKKLKAKKAKTKNKIVIDDYKKALSRFGTTQPQAPQQNLEKLTYKELQKLAKEKGLSAKGKTEDIIKRLKEFEASQQIETTKDSKSEIEKLNKEKEELLETLSSLQEPMSEKIQSDLEKETEVFGALADIEEAKFTEIESRIEEAQKKAEEKFSKEELEKAKIIDEKFEDIIEAIIKSKINLFFDGNTSVETNHRKC